MRTNGLWMVAAVVALTAAAGSVVAAGAAWAGKPAGGGGGAGDGGTGGGKIYFTDTANALWSMNSDGSGKTAEPSNTVLPPYLTSGGHRWQAVIRGVTTEPFQFPGGGRYQAVFARRDDGVMVQLTSQLDLEISIIFSRSVVALVPDGGRVSWVARRWTDGVVTDGGLYVADLAFDADGNVTGLVTQPAAPAFPRPLVTTSGGQAWNVWPDIDSVSWAPDSTQLAYGFGGSQSSWQVGVANLSGSNRVLVSKGNDPLWSPDGGKIAYQDGRDLFTVAVDGSGIKLVGRGSPRTFAGAPAWSPTGSHLAYTESDYSGTGPAPTVFRVTATGGKATSLTSGWLEGWTE